MQVAIRYADSPKVFGALVLPLRDAVVRRFGAALVARAIAGLPADEQDEWAAMRGDAWMRSETLEHAMRAIADEAGADALAVVDAASYEAVRATVGTIWRVLLSVSGDLALLRRTPMFYARSYDRGSFTGQRLAPGRAELVLEGWPDAPDLHVVAMAAGTRAVLEAAGRAELRIAPRRDGDVVRFDVTWRA